MNFEAWIAQVLFGVSKIEDIIARGDVQIAEHPELEPMWLEFRAKLVAAKDNPENAARILEAFTQAAAIIFGAVGPVGKSHAHGG